MKILKEGRTRTRLFACKSCGCEFELTEREVNENTTFEGNEIIKVKTFIYPCPFCKDEIGFNAALARNPTGL